MAKLADSHFEKLKEIARYTRKPEMMEEGRDLLIRFLDSCSDLQGSQPVVDSLCIHFGLFPYLSTIHSSLSTSEALAYEFHRPAVELHNERFVFHSEQARIFHKLLDGEDVILSAPTSFGKSIILDAVVASRKWNNIVVIVPTVALIDEVRRRMVKFSDQYNIITHPSQRYEKRNIYVLTQERFLELQNGWQVDIFMIDEFYKLCSYDSGDQRMSLLNIAWKRLRDTGAQYYLTGPNIDRFEDGLDAGFRRKLYVSNFKTVAVDVQDRSIVSDVNRISDMNSYWDDIDGSTLIFVSAPKRAEEVAIKVSDFSTLKKPCSFAREVANWIANNFHLDWSVVTALQNGVGVHTGPMPRSIQRIMIRLFAEERISTLVCTSTLIEGVNTSAKNVIIYDKKINRKPIDYFTFSNVRGRAGRMAHHYLGRVITYMAPPNEELKEVDIPIDSQSNNAPLSSLIHIADGDLSGDSQLRLRAVTSQNILSIKTIRENLGFDPELQIEAARVLLSEKSLRSQFVWSGNPTDGQAYSVLEFGFSNLLARNQKKGMNIRRLWGMLKAVRNSDGKLSSLVSVQLRFKRADQDMGDVIRDVLSYQRNWMGFTIPSILRAAQNIYNDVASSLNEPSCDFRSYILRVENLFLSPNLLELEEYGLPLPLAQKFEMMGMACREGMDEVLLSFINLAQNNYLRSKLSDVELWIVDDVLEGLGVK